MAKESKKERAKEYDSKLAIEGTLDEVLKVSVPKKENFDDYFIRNMSKYISKEYPDISAKYPEVGRYIIWNGDWDNFDWSLGVDASKEIVADLKEEAKRIMSAYKNNS